MSNSTPSPPAPLWSPSSDQVADTEVARLCQSLDLDVSWESLHDWSITSPEEFWTTVWNRYALIGDRGECIIERGERFRETRFFPDASLNLAENLLMRPQRLPESDAITSSNETGQLRSVTLAELRDEVSLLQQAMVAAGIGVGDTVAAWLPNITEAIAVFLAANSLGAVFTSSSPDFGVDGVVDRFGQVAPKLLFATDAYLYAGKTHSTTERLAEIVSLLPSLRATIVIPYLNAEPETPDGTSSLADFVGCLLYTSPSPRDRNRSRMPSSA